MPWDSNPAWVTASRPSGCWRGACLHRGLLVLSVNDLQAEWFAAMRRADFEAAWCASDRLLASRAPGERCWQLPRHAQWVWDGSPFQDRRVLVRCYHGLGDTLQFARLLPSLARLAAATTVWAQAPLIPLLQTLPDAERMRFLPLHDGTPEVEFDVDIEIMELAHALRVHADDVGALVPYFSVAPAARASARCSVGLLRETGDWDDRRTLPLELVRQLAAFSSIELCNLQLGAPLPGLRDLSTPDILELARRIRSLDLVIAPDTMLAHLAGALAAPTWVLLPAEADWRWHQPDRTDSPWYPTLRLFRQPRAGDWGLVIERVLKEISSIAR
jgi:hypothetical protein